MTKQVRVLVVDDSALMRKLIPQILEHDPSIEVVGTAMDGNFGLKKIEELKPHVITLDLEMPGLNGIDTLKEIMRRHRIPVIVVSSHTTRGASVTLKALSLGAFDFVAKPTDVSSRMQEVAQELISKIKAAAQSRHSPSRTRPAGVTKFHLRWGLPRHIPAPHRSCLAPGLPTQKHGLREPQAVLSYLQERVCLDAFPKPTSAIGSRGFSARVTRAKAKRC